MVQTRSKTRAILKLDVRSQKTQGIYKNTTNSLTGASAASAGAIWCAMHALPHSVTTQQPNAYGTSKSPRNPNKGFQVKVCPRCFQGTFEKCCLAQDQCKGRQEEEGWQASRAQTQAREGDSKEEGSSILHPPLQKMIRHFDVDLWFNVMYIRYEADIYLNGVKVQEMFDFSLAELKERIKVRQVELDVTSSAPLTKAVCWATEPSVWSDKITPLQIQGIEAKDPVSDSSK